MKKKDQLRKNQPHKAVVVAILKDEEKFVEEWVVYHRLLGFEHFYLYDNDPKRPLNAILKNHLDYVTIIPWNPWLTADRQSAAYNHFLKRFGKEAVWAAFLDADEFFVLKKHSHIQAFLDDFSGFDSVSFNWQMFGNNGYIDDPQGLVIESLTKRSERTSPYVKTISKISSILFVRDPHYQVVKEGSVRVDPNKKLLSTPSSRQAGCSVCEPYEGSTDVACVNHYWCRSSRRFLDRPQRGVACHRSHLFQKEPWRFSREGCLAMLNDVVVKKHNAYTDEYMLKFVPAIKKYMEEISTSSNNTNAC